MSENLPNLERQLRRDFERLGYRLHKTPARSWYRDHYPAGYMVSRDNVIVFGCWQREYEATLEEVRAWAAELVATAEDA